MIRGRAVLSVPEQLKDWSESRHLVFQVSRRWSVPETVRGQVNIAAGAATTDLFANGLPRIFADLARDDDPNRSETGIPEFRLVPGLAEFSVKPVSYKFARKEWDRVAGVNLRYGIYEVEVHARTSLRISVNERPVVVLYGEGTHTRKLEVKESYGTTQDSDRKREAFVQAEFPFNHLVAGVAAVALENAYRSIAEQLIARRESLEAALAERRDLSLAHDYPSYSEVIPTLVEPLCAGLAEGPPLRVAIVGLTDGDGRRGTGIAFLEGELTAGLLRSSRVLIVERSHLDQVLAEARFSLSDLTVDGLRRLGKLANADAVVVGTALDMGPFAKVSVRLVDTETGRVLGAASGRFALDEATRRILRQ